MNSLLSCAELRPAVLLALILPGQTMAESPALKPDGQSHVQSNHLAPRCLVTAKSDRLLGSGLCFRVAIAFMPRILVA